MSDTRQAVIKSATTLFAERGFRGASIRDICEHAGASSNAVTYHFGSKEELYTTILTGFVSVQLDLAQRTLSTTPKTREEFVVRLELCFAQLLDAYLENREPLRILSREFEELLPRSDQSVLDDAVKVSLVITEFVRDAIPLGFVAADIDPSIVAGFLLDRLDNQARFADAHKKFFGVTTLDKEYREEWIRATLRIVLFGICGTDQSAA